LATDRLCYMRVRGLRVLEDARLDLVGLTVLIGENGTGKSSILEALEILRRVAASANSLQELYGIHGGVPQLLRSGAQRLVFEVGASGGTGPLVYEISFARVGDQLAIESERLDQGPVGDEPGPLHVLERVSGTTRVFDTAQRKLVDVRIPPDRPLLSSFGVLPPQPAIARMVSLLSRIRVHVPFDTTPPWISQDARRQRTPMRTSVVVEPAEGVTRLGANLANAWMRLRNEHDEAHWRDTMEYVRLGLGPDVESVQLRPDPGGGNIGLQVKFARVREPVPAHSLSDGMLAYLAFVALCRQGEEASLFAFDEPETHLHPLLLVRVLQMLDELAERRPVVLATHSDRLLDALAEPAAAAVLCELAGDRSTRLLRPDPAALGTWMERFRGIGHLRSEGYERQVFPTGAGS